MTDMLPTAFLAIAFVAIFLLTRLTWQITQLEERIEDLEDARAADASLADFKRNGGATIEGARAARSNEDLNALMRGQP